MAWWARIEAGARRWRVKQSSKEACAPSAHLPASGRFKSAWGWQILSPRPKKLINSANYRIWFSAVFVIFTYFVSYLYPLWAPLVQDRQKSLFYPPDITFSLFRKVEPSNAVFWPVLCNISMLNKTCLKAHMSLVQGRLQQKSGMNLSWKARRGGRLDPVTETLQWILRFCIVEIITFWESLKITRLKSLADPPCSR